jgi:hypothetical protein
MQIKMHKLEGTVYHKQARDRNKKPAKISLLSHKKWILSNKQ